MIISNTLKIIIFGIIAIIISGFIVLFNMRNGDSDEKPVFCAQDAKLCSDGSYVSRVPPKCDFALCHKENLIIIESPKANEKISSPILI